MAVVSNSGRSLPAPFRALGREISVLGMNRLIALSAVTVAFAGGVAAPSLAERSRVGDLTWLEQQLSREPLVWPERDVDGTQRRVRFGPAELRRLELTRAAHAFRAGNDVPLRRYVSRTSALTSED
jgi:hypothetical protein